MKKYIRNEYGEIGVFKGLYSASGEPMYHFQDYSRIATDSELESGSDNRFDIDANRPVPGTTYYFPNDPDAVYGGGAWVCMTTEDIICTFLNPGDDTDDLMGKFHEADADELNEYGING
jgi:hypothetical protein